MVNFSLVRGFLVWAVGGGEGLMSEYKPFTEGFYKDRDQPFTVQQQWASL